MCLKEKSDLDDKNQNVAVGSRQIAESITDFREVYTAICERWPRNRKQASFV
jgi:hypothetical protein